MNDLDIPDAPWVRKAETVGMPEPDRVPVCPICYAREPERIYINSEGDALGCENCVDWTDAWEWIEKHPEDSGPND